eukprot:gene11343-11492_t
MPASDDAKLPGPGLRTDRWSPQKNKRRRRIDRLMDEWREAQRSQADAGLKQGLVPKQGFESVKGLAAFASVMKDLAQHQQRQQELEEEDGLWVGGMGEGGEGKVAGSSDYQGPAAARDDGGFAAAAATIEGAQIEIHPDLEEVVAAAKQRRRSSSGTAADGEESTADAAAGAPAGQESSSTKGKPLQLPAWKERMALRHKFWSTSHGFKLGRKLGEWAAAEDTEAAAAPPAVRGPPVGGLQSLQAAAAGGAKVVAAVVAGGLHRSPVKLSRGQLRRAAGVTGAAAAAAGGGGDASRPSSDSEEYNEDLQQAIQMSLVDAAAQVPAAEVSGPNSNVDNASVKDRHTADATVVADMDAVATCTLQEVATESVQGAASTEISRPSPAARSGFLVDQSSLVAAACHSGPSRHQSIHQQQLPPQQDIVNPQKAAAPPAAATHLGSFQQRLTEERSLTRPAHHSKPEGQLVTSGGKQQQFQGAPLPPSAVGGGDNVAAAAGAATAVRQPVDIEAELASLAEEQAELKSAVALASRNTATPTQDMIVECQELLALFGLPFIVAPGEAEAQCAWLESAGLVEGVVTDDNDAFLFGAQHVYRHLFEDKRYVEEYHMSDVTAELGLNQQQLVCLAMLLGSDYTEGVAGIGVVNALEVVSAWPGGLSGLSQFKQWLEGPDERVLAAAAAVGGHQKQQRRRRSSRQQAGHGAGSEAAGTGRGINTGTAEARSSRGCRSNRRRQKRQGNSSGEWQSEPGSSDDDADVIGDGDVRVSEPEAAGQLQQHQQPSPPSTGEGLSKSSAEAPCKGADAEEHHQQPAAAADGAETAAQRGFKRTHKGVRRTWHLPASFPSARVMDAYQQPQVDRNPARFNFGKPDSILLQEFCRERFGWNDTKIDELLLPVLRSYGQRSSQMRIDQYLTHKQRFAKIKSKRLQQAVAKITGVDVNPELFLAQAGHIPEEPLQPLPQSGSSLNDATELAGDVNPSPGDVDAAARAPAKAQQELLPGHGAGVQPAEARKISTAVKASRLPGPGTGRVRGRNRKHGQRAAAEGPRGVAAASMAEVAAASMAEDDEIGSAKSDLAFIRLMQEAE